MIVGATGLVASELLQLLLKDSYYRTIITVSRRQLDITHENLVQVIVDYDRLEDIEELLEATDVYCCLGTTMAVVGSREAFYKVDYTYPVEVAKIALKNESSQFLLISAMGANKNSNIFYNRVKGEVEEKIKSLGFPSTHIFRPSLLLGDRKEDRKGEKFMQKLSQAAPFLFMGPLAKYRPIKAIDVAKGMIAMAKKQVVGISTIDSSQIQKLADTQ